jgi:hypothetical protein
MEISKLIDTLLNARGVSGEAREIFLKPDYERDTLYSPSKGIGVYIMMW